MILSPPLTDGSAAMNQTTDATTIFAPLWRRKWIILAVAILVAGASYAYYRRQRPTYQSVTQVYLGAAAEEAAPGEKVSTKGQGANILDQAAVINSIVVETVRKQLRREHKIALARGTVIRAKGAEKGQFVAITTEAHTPKAAALLANLTAQTYIRRQQVEHQRVTEKAIAIARRQLRRIEAANSPAPVATPGSKTTRKSASPSTASILQAASLNSKINQLESNLVVAGAQQVKPADPRTALQLSPKPRQDAIFGFVLGLALAAIAAYVLSRFDRRLRTMAAVEQVFGTQILAALPKVGRPVVHRDGQATPSKQLLEPLRRLHTGLQLGDRLSPDPTRPPRVILFISPDAGDGKSTLVADLALTQRDAGQRVAVVEANFRRPVLARLLGVEGTRGLADALAGTISVNEAMLRVLPPHTAESLAEEQPAAGGLTTIQSTSALFLLAGGSAANPPALLGHPAMAELLRGVAADFDYVLIDAPSPLEFSDVLPMLKLVDGLVMVARAAHTREVSAQRLRQMLSHTDSAPLLGVVANCVAPADSERYGFGSPNGRIWPLRLIGR
jgi:Mrp family chromosome partitioning ATPase/capsular polysaccharide biosynthesis protein